MPEGQCTCPSQPSKDCPTRHPSEKDSDEKSATSAAHGCGRRYAHDCSVVDSSKLRQLLPSKDLPGFKRHPPMGSIDTIPFGRLSSAEVKYETPGEVPRIIQLRIADFAEHMYAAGLLLGLTREEGRQETQEGYSKSVVVKGKYRGKETGNRGMSGGQVEFVVANRFVVTVQSTRVPDVGVLYSLIDAIDLAALEKLP